MCVCVCVCVDVQCICDYVETTSLVVDNYISFEQVVSSNAVIVLRTNTYTHTHTWLHYMQARLTVSNNVNNNYVHTCTGRDL